MRDEELQNLLRQADGEHESELVAPGALARSVRRLDRARRRRARALALSVVLIMAGAVGWRQWPAAFAPREEQVQLAGVPDVVREPSAPGASDGVLRPADVNGAMLADAEQLTGEIALHQRTARRMLADLAHEHETRNVQRELAQEDPLEEVRQRLDRVAFRMICQADRLRAAMQPSEEAIAIYRDVIRLFPTTPAAALARQRLGSLGNPQGDS